MLRDVDVDLGSGQGHINTHSTCRSTSVPNHLTVASRTTEIWLFEFREISTFGEVWTLVIAFIEGNSKIGLRQAVAMSRTITIKHQFSAPRQNGGDRPRNVQFSQLRKLRDLDLDLRSGRGFIGPHIWMRSTHTPNYMAIGKKLFADVWTDIRTDRRTHLSSNPLGHRLAWRKNIGKMVYTFADGQQITMTFFFCYATRVINGIGLK